MPLSPRITFKRDAVIAPCACGGHGRAGTTRAGGDGLPEGAAVLHQKKDNLARIDEMRTLFLTCL